MVEKLARFLEAKRSGAEYKARCPAHEDKKESLSFRDSEDGRLLVYCHAGCSYSDIMNSLKSKGFAMEQRIDHKESRPNFKSAKSNNVSQLKIVKTYDYTSETGKFLYQKVRYEPKDFRIRSKGANGEWEWANKSGKVVLFNLPKVVVGARKGHTVIVCEGEKDVETIESLGLDGYVATTNLEGAKTWRREYTQALQGVKVVIMQDNDEAGAKRTENLVEQLRNVAISVSVVCFPECPEKGDVSDYLDMIPAIERKEALLNKIAGAQILYAQPLEGWSPVPGRQSAAPYEYVELLLALPKVKSIRRCLFTDEIMINIQDGGWEYANSTKNLQYWKSYAREYGDYFSLLAYEDYLERHRSDKMSPQLLIDIPEWDERDRIYEMANVFRFSNVSQTAFYQLLLYWGAGIFKRLRDPQYQNICMIFSGHQGCGKDTLIDALTQGFGDYRKMLSIDSNTLVEAKRQLHSGIIFRISEFDRTAKTDIAGLKDIITTPCTDERLAYDRRSATRPVRASFIASCNRDNILIDDTGNRRFWVFEAEYLGLEMIQYPGGKPEGTGKTIDCYPGHRDSPTCHNDRLQILAQFRRFADTDFKPSQSAMSEMGRYMSRIQPDSVDDCVIDEYRAALGELAAVVEHPQTGERGFTWSDISASVIKIGNKYGMGVKKIQSLIKRRGYQSVCKVDGKTIRLYSFDGAANGQIAEL